MKKNNLIILMFATLLFLSCNKTDDDNDDEVITTESLLIGVWQPTMLSTICSSGNNDEFMFTDCMLTSTTTFSEEGIYQDILNLDTLEGCENSYTLNGAWVIVGETIEINIDDGQQIVFSILLIDNNVLILGFEGGGPDSFCNDGSTVIRNTIEYSRME